MLSNNLKTARKNAGISQEELAGRLHVVRQTVSKWEKGLSVPDSELLVKIALELEVSVSELLGEEILPAAESETVREISGKLEAINARLALECERRRKVVRAVCAVVLALAGLYLIWNAVVALSVLVPDRAAEAVIGGADGPTAIWVVAGFDASGIVTAAIVAAAAVWGLVWSRRRR